MNLPQLPPRSYSFAEASVSNAIVQSPEPSDFERIVERVRGNNPEVTRAQIAQALAGLIRKRRVYLNSAQTGFLAIRREDRSQASLIKSNALRERE